jgi:hypothetical protein
MKEWMADGFRARSDVDRAGPADSVQLAQQQGLLVTA